MDSPASPKRTGTTVGRFTTVVLGVVLVALAGAAIASTILGDRALDRVAGVNESSKTLNEARSRRGEMVDLATAFRATKDAKARANFWLKATALEKRLQLLTSITTEPDLHDRLSRATDAMMAYELSSEAWLDAVLRRRRGDGAA
jgi:hypothetical protein